MKDYKKYLNPANKVPMIGILEGNELVKKINLTNKKVSIRHYLNTYLFPIGESDGKQPLFPLYYRVIFNQQSVKIKSTINRAYTIDEFNLDNLSNEDKHLMRREALALTYIVSSIYKQVEDSANKDEDFKDKNDFGFDINIIFKSFSFRYYELPFVLERALLEKIKIHAEFLKEDKSILDIFNYSEVLNSFQLLQFLKSKNTAWKSFEKLFNPEIWVFNIHYYLFLNSSNLYRDLGATIIDLFYEDLEKTTVVKNDDSDLDMFLNSPNQYKKIIPPNAQIKGFEVLFKAFYANSKFPTLIDDVKKILL
jgi:hypothetical protein